MTQPLPPMTGVTPERILAIDVRPSRMGYAVFEGATNLLDYGVKTLRRDTCSVRIANILRIFQPSVVVMCRYPARSRRRSPYRENIAGAIRKDLRRKSIPLKFVNERMRKRFFLLQGKKSKHEIASMIANWFPPLEWELPPKRKIWEKEHWRMPMFDAAANAIVYFLSIDPEAVYHLTDMR